MHLEINHIRIEAGRNIMLKVNICDTITERLLSQNVGKSSENRMLG
jgi:hypothetical protein